MKKLNISMEGCFERNDLVNKQSEWYKNTFGCNPPFKNETKDKKEKKKDFYNDKFNTDNFSENKGTQNQGTKINIKQFDPNCGYPVHLKVLTLGPQACGKSCMVKRLCENKFINR